MVAVEDGEVLNVDESLARRIRAGDRAAENELVALYAGRVFAMMLVRVRDRESARELTDDVLMAVVTALRRGTVAQTSRLGSFFHGTAVNVANNYFRLRGRTPRMESLDAGTAGAEPRVEDDRHAEWLAARRCIGQLAAKDQEILLLTLVEGLKPSEIAVQLGMSPEAIRQRKSRALQAIRQWLDAASRNPVGKPPERR